MPTINVAMRAGRSTEDKRKLVASITDAVVKSLNCPPEVVTITIYDIAKENHAIAGVLDADKK